MINCIFTGMQPTNKLTIGNYLGVIPNIINNKISDKIFFSADLHALTTNNIINANDNLQVLKLFISVFGDKPLYYIQSQHNQITYLAWILNTITPVGQLFRMTQFKSKSNIEENSLDNINSGLLNYPILMAADILIHCINNSIIVPVGVDQTQHIELVRDLCIKINSRLNTQIFNLPTSLIVPETKIHSLQSTSKMSKSDTNSYATLFLSDTEDIIHKKIMRAKTDSMLMPENIQVVKETRTEIYNLCTLYSLFSSKDFSYIEYNYGDNDISKFKNDLSELAIHFISNIGNKLKNISNSQVLELVERDKTIMDNKFNDTINMVQKIIINK